MRRRPASAVLLLTFLCAFAGVARAQTISGIIAGTVVDNKGKPLPSVSITAKNPLSGRVYPASTNSQGYYRILEVPPGFYEVQADLGGFQTTRHTSVRVSVNRTTIEDFNLQIQAKEEVLSQVSRAPMTDKDSATLSTAFPEKQITELPILTRDVNSLGLLAPGSVSVRTFSFASTLVPFSVNGSRGRDNNFIIDSVDNNEPLFGGAASQFTNTDIFSEYAILTSQLKAEFGRNSGATVNAITKSGSNDLHGTAFWFGQDDPFNAMTAVEKTAQLTSPARFYENQFGATLGGAIKKNKTFFFISYQWDRARNNLTDVFPVLSTLPTPAGLTALQGQAASLNPVSLAALTGLRTVKVVPGLTAPCFRPPAPAGFSTTNPCLVNPVSAVTVNATPIPFNVYRIPNGNVFDVRDHQFSGRVDHRINNSNDIYARYLFDDLLAPRFPLANAGESAFADLGLYPDWRLQNRQRTQSLLFNHRYYGISSLNELRFSYSRVSQGVGAFGLPGSRLNSQAAATIKDSFDLGSPFGNAFPSAGGFITLGRDSKPSKITSNTYEIQDNFSLTRGKHSIKFGGNFVRIESNIRSTPSDLGQYIYTNNPGLENFLTEPTASSGFITNADVVSQSFTNVIADSAGSITGQGRDALMLREYDAFVFAQDDWRIFKNLTLSLGLRYENFGQPVNSIHKFNPAGPHVAKDNNNFGPRVGLAWSPIDNLVFRAGYSISYNPTVLNIPLLVWQSGPISPTITTDALAFAQTQPSGVWPNRPLTLGDINQTVGGCSRFFDFFNVFITGNPALPGRADAGSVPLINCSNRETVDPHLRNPYIQNFTAGIQYQIASDWLIEINGVGSRGTRLFQRTDKNPYAGWDLTCYPQLFAVRFAPGQCRNSRLDDTHGDITEVTNGGDSTFYGLQASVTKRLSRTKRGGDLTMTATYSWSHMIDNASEIFGPGVRFLGSNAFKTNGTNIDLLFDPLSSAPVESITPFSQIATQTGNAERANSSFDRRHRFAASFVWEPFPTRGVLLRGWQLNGVISVQTGQFFSPLNAAPLSACADSNGDGLVGNDRPDIGNPHAPLNSVALLADPACIDPTMGYVDLKGNPILPSAAHFVQRPLQPSAFAGGTAGRNSLLGPGLANLDLSVYKNLKFHERYTLQFRWEVYNALNHANFGNPIGNAFASDAQPTPAFAFSATRTAAAISGIIPENALDAISINGGGHTFLSKTTMNTSNRRMQFGIKFIF